MKRIYHPGLEGPRWGSLNRELLHRRRAELLLALYSFFSLAALLKRWDLRVRAVKALIFFFLAPSSISLSHLVNDGAHLAPRLPALAHAFYENQVLRSELQSYSLLQVQVRQLLEENDRLRDALHFDRRRFPEALAGEVIARDPVHWFSGVVIDRGGAQGVEAGMPVLAFDAGRMGLVGRVEEVTRTSAKVLLISDSLSSISVSIGPRRELAVLQGQDSEDPLLNFIVPQAEIQVNDEVVTAGLGEVIPPGIPVGRVTAVGSPASRAFRQAVVQPYAPLGRLGNVWVLKRARKDAGS